jgi:membrane protease YdiL (CAAX protease family)
VGLGFGVALLAVGLAGGWRPRLTAPRPAVAVGAPLVLGLVGGAILVGFALVGRGSGLADAGILEVGRPSVFLPWAVVTGLVASAEEIVLRGALFDRLSRAAGVGLAVLVTSFIFALMHVPTYGWAVVPLDIGVGIWLAGLRILSGGIAAPAVAHFVADLATWWL